MLIRKIQGADLKGKKVLLRADFNVAVQNGKVKEKLKIKAINESLRYLLNQNCKIALISHLGRPNGKNNSEFSLEQIVGDITYLLGIKVKFINDCIGEKVKRGLNNLRFGEVLLLENVRFYPQEELNNVEFSQKLGDNFELFINDAFSVCHRNQASVTGVAKILPSFAGFRLQKEIENLERIRNKPKNPAVAIIGGAKIETKLPLIHNFEKNYEHVLLGGKIANEAIDQKMNFSQKVILPSDFVDDRMDIGIKTVKIFSDIISEAKTIIWNGPMGKFEEEKYAVGTKKILDAVISSRAFTLVGGGESVQLLEENNALDKISFVSTGGGAMLEFLSGNRMPGLEILESLPE